MINANTQLDWKALYNLSLIHGDAFYLLDLNAFYNNYSELLEALQRIYTDSNLAYSYKTNYIPELCMHVHEQGGLAEVVSWMEYDLAVRLGVPANRIIFNGPYKGQLELEAALVEGALVNIDNLHEVGLIEQIATKHAGKPFSVGLRCNFDPGNGQISRFGFDIEGIGFLTAIKRLTRISQVRIRGLHSHFSTPERSVSSYRRRAKTMISLFQKFKPVLKDLDFLNLGGGFFSKMGNELRTQFPFEIPTYLEYAKAICEEFVAVWPDGSGPRLIIEPGAAITADIMKFAAVVLDVKTIRDKTFATVAGSAYNIKPTFNEKNLPMVLESPLGRVRQDNNNTVDFGGYTCMDRDILYRGFMGTVVEGDFVVFENVGAYTIVLKPPFILPNVPILAFDPSVNSYRIIKRKETVDDVFQTFSGFRSL